MNILSKISRVVLLSCFLQAAIVPLNGAWEPPVFVSTLGEDVVGLNDPVLSVNSSNNAVAVWNAPASILIILKPLHTRLVQVGVRL